MDNLLRLGGGHEFGLSMGLGRKKNMKMMVEMVTMVEMVKMVEGVVGVVKRGGGGR